MYSSIAAIPLWYWVAAIGILVVLLWLTVLIQGAGLRKTQKRYRQWVGRSGTDVEKLLPQTLERIQQLSEEVRRLEVRIDYLEKVSGQHYAPPGSSGTTRFPISAVI